MKQLDSSVFHVLDLDVPENILRFSVVGPPKHGTIGSQSSEDPVQRRQEANYLAPVVDFTNADLLNGTSSRGELVRKLGPSVSLTFSLSYFHETHWENWACMAEKNPFSFRQGLDEEVKQS